MTPDHDRLGKLLTAGVYPIEIYSEKRVNEFLAEDRLTPEERRRVNRIILIDKGVSHLRMLQLIQTLLVVD